MIDWLFKNLKTNISHPYLINYNKNIMNKNCIFKKIEHYYKVANLTGVTSSTTYATAIANSNLIRLIGKFQETISLPNIGSL